MEPRGETLTTARSAGRCFLGRFLARPFSDNFPAFNFVPVLTLFFVFLFAFDVFAVLSTAGVASLASPLTLFSGKPTWIVGSVTRVVTQLPLKKKK